MKTVWKYQLRRPHLYEEQWAELEIDMPTGARPLHVGTPNGELFLWMLVESSRAPETRRIHVCATERALPLAGAFVGSVIDGPFVWHVFIE